MGNIDHRDLGDSMFRSGKMEDINGIKTFWHLIEGHSDRVEMGDEAIDVKIGNGGKLIEELKKRAGSISDARELKNLASEIAKELDY